jgi:uncharacterized membrane protein
LRPLWGRPVAWWRHRLFQVGVVIKGLDGALEVVGGLVLAVVGSAGVGHLVAFLTQHELSEDPRDAVARWIVGHFAHIGSGTAHFAAAYLLVHGAVKLVLVGGLIRERIGVFPWALGFLGLFILYQGYRLSVRPSMGLGLLTVLDLAVMALVWREYEALRREV